VDETTDVSQTEQLSLSVRFIKDTKVHEKFCALFPVSSTTGKDLASTILTQLPQLGLNLEHMRGQGYDSASIGVQGGGGGRRPGLENFQDKLCFSGQAQVAQKS